MLCQNCHMRTANVHYVKTVNNSKIKVHLCEQCAKEKENFVTGSQFSYSDFLSGLMNFDPDQGLRSDAMCKPVCAKCGLSYEEFQKQGKMGCSQCYELYGNTLDPLVKRLHGNTEHRGKVPLYFRKTLSKSQEIEELKVMLNQAVKCEEYEKAAELRDRIKALETEKL